ncbi:MAG TPA: glycerol-3-phosphate 1-O-acyltransferase PlsY [Gaiellaceae bacterium]|nr:glycerol-3-phosphate 1-O-acyltransferase PlsY [Gaiellaceae bacterium]
MSYVAAVLGGYLAGSIPTGYWLVRLFRKIDIRRVGSRSIGATNVWRVMGWKVGLPTIVLDVAKGLVPALVASMLVDDLAGALAGGAAMLGHARPVFLRFERGGKAVATTGGVLLGLAPEVALLALGVWILTFLVSRYVSVASMAAAVSVPVFAFALDESWPVKILALAGAAAVVFLHRENIKRLVAHREPRVQLAGMFRR